jgi:tetratricopeptide (TPR) repeat protein
MSASPSANLDTAAPDWGVPLIIVTLAVAVLLVYAPCFGHPFVHFDDDDYVLENAHVQAGLTADGFRYAFTTLDCGNWHPLTWLSLELDQTLYGGKARGFHVTNVVLHVTSCIVLFLVLNGMTGMLWRSAFVAGLFALHPLQVEVVAWVAERKGVLSTLFWMLTLAAYAWYVRRPKVGRYLLVVVALILGLMAKPLLLSIPFVLLLLDYWPLGRWQKQRRVVLWEKVPLVLLVVGCSIIAYVTQKQIKALPSLDDFPPWVRLCNALESYVAYLGMTLWPLNLAAYYPHPGRSISVAWSLGAGVVLLVLTLLFLGAGRRRPYLIVGWLWYLLALVPMIGLVQIGRHALADRYAYVPVIGLFLLFTWAMAEWLQARRVPAFVQALSALGVLALSGSLAYFQTSYWGGDRTLWEHALEVTGNNGMAHNNLGKFYYLGKRYDKAAEQFQQATKQDPANPLFHDNWAILLSEFGREEEALSASRQAIALDSNNAGYWFHFANTLHMLSRYDESLAAFREALRHDASHPQIHNNLGNLLLDMGRREEAREEFSQAMALDRKYVRPYMGLGRLEAEAGQWVEAATAFRRAVELEPTWELAHFNLGQALQASGRLDDAWIEFATLARLGFAPARPALRLCERLRNTLPQLAEVVAGRSRPADNAERLALAELCVQPFAARYVLAARLYQEAFHSDPKLEDDLAADTRANAAIAAAQAACGLGKDAAELTDADRVRLRQQALAWLGADLKALQRECERPEAQQAVKERLQSWQKEAGLACVRDRDLLNRLPDAERVAWQAFWQELAGTLAGIRTQEQPEKKPFADKAASL